MPAQETISPTRSLPARSCSRSDVAARAPHDAARAPSGPKIPRPRSLLDRAPPRCKKTPELEGWPVGRGRRSMTVSRKSFLFTSESVSEGHPDKVCDRISDEVVDAFFELGPRHGWDARQVRVACETLATTNRVVIAGETRGPSAITKDYVRHLARLAIKDIGYEQDGFHWEKANIEVHLHAQSTDIAQGVDAGGNRDEGAGDQGIMFGYACQETPALMPGPIYYAHRILKLMSEARRAGETEALGPDAKSQVTLRYENDKPVEATQIVVSTQHLDEHLSSNDVQSIIEPYVRKALPSDWITKSTVWHVNPTGKFVIGGPDGDCGLTGRKIIVDTYGGAAPHGGGAFSGKDPSKVDRSAA